MASSPKPAAPAVGVIMGSRSDWETMKAAADILRQFEIAHECKVVSAHRTPNWMVEYARDAEGGVPVATMAIGAAGATNAALFAVGVLATQDQALRAKLQAFRDERARAVREETLE